MSGKESFIWLLLLLGIPAFAIVTCLVTFDPNNRYVVVEKRDGCDLVRYNPGPFSRYEYFLKCRNSTVQSSRGASQ